jgi:hypothetical protein
MDDAKNWSDYWEGTPFGDCIHNCHKRSQNPLDMMYNLSLQAAEAYCAKKIMSDEAAEIYGVTWTDPEYRACLARCEGRGWSYEDASWNCEPLLKTKHGDAAEPSAAKDAAEILDKAGDEAKDAAKSAAEGLDTLLDLVKWATKNWPLVLIGAYLLFGKGAE